MKLLNRTLLLALLLTLPLSAADPLYGVWKTRPSGKPGDTSKQTVTIEPGADGIKFTTDIDFGSGGGGMSTNVRHEAGWRGSARLFGRQSRDEVAREEDRTQYLRRLRDRTWRDRHIQDDSQR